MPIGKFLAYHNAVPIAISFALLGAGGVFAATNPDAIYSSSQQVLSVDNTYIANKDFSSWTPEAQIVDVTEDTDNYYVTYKLTTIDVVNSVWKDVVENKSMTVSKAVLGEYRDLGLYVTEQIKQVVDAELARLKETQTIERRQVSQKTVATVYGGLIGKMLDTSTETLPGYTPVVTPPPQEVQTASVAASGSSQQSPTSSNTSAGAPIIQVLGKNPAVIPTGTNYADLGAVVSDDKDQNLGIHIFLGGKEVTNVSLDTSISSEQKIAYRATDTDGHTTEVYRLVIVYDKSQPAPEVTPIPPMTVPQVQVVETQQTQIAQQESTQSTSSGSSTQASSDTSATTANASTTQSSNTSASSTAATSTTSGSGSTASSASTTTEETPSDTSATPPAPDTTASTTAQQ